MQPPSNRFPLFAASRAYVALALLIVSFIGLAVRMYRAWESTREIVVNSTPDDAFYYFEIARNVAHGHNVTFDGETLTNGFHPLWLVLIAPIFALSDRELSVHLALALGAVIGTMTIPLVFEITRRLTMNWRASLLSAFFFAVHPVIASYAVNGLETSLTLFFVALSTLLFITIVQSDEPPSARQLTWFGLSLGLMALARTDTVVGALALLSFVVFRAPAGARTRDLALVIVPAFIVVAPWLIWSLVTFHTPLQISGVAGGLLERQGYKSLHGDSIGVVTSHGVHLAWTAVTSTLPAQFLAPSQSTRRVFWAGTALFIALLTLVPAPNRRTTLQSLFLISIPLSGFLATIVAEAGIRWFVRPWYFAPFAVFAGVVLGIAIDWAEGALLWGRDRLTARFRQSHGMLQKAAWPAAITAGLYLLATAFVVREYGPQRDAFLFKYRWQTNVLAASAWLTTNTSQDTRAAAFNAGILGYYSERTVVNLDGVVNEDAYRAARDCQTRDYLRKKSVDLVVDSLGALQLGSCGLDRDLQKVVILGEIDAGPQVYVMELKE